MDAEAGPAAGSTTREPPGTAFNVQLRALPVDGRTVLRPPDPAHATTNTADERSHINYSCAAQLYAPP